MADVLHHIDEPTRWDTGTPVLIVSGWCLDRAGDTVVAIEMHTPRGVISTPVGLARPDVAAAFDHIPGSATSGFTFWVPNRPGDLDPSTLFAVHRDGRRTALRTIAPKPCDASADA